jgi:hypothetical protein
LHNKIDKKLIETQGFINALKFYLIFISEEDKNLLSFNLTIYENHINTALFYALSKLEKNNFIYFN